jgi:hypothetical protein
MNSNNGRFGRSLYQLYQLCIAACIGSVCSSNALANGFVKTKGAHYSKVAATVMRARTIGSGSTAYTQNTQELSLYSELGTPLPWPLQLSLCAPYKSIERSSPDFGDKFTSAAFGDAILGMKTAIGSVDLVKAKQFPLTLALAADFGLTVPTTASKFRKGNETQRLGGLDPSGAFLIAPIDRGLTRWSSGIGLSLYSSLGWLSAAVKQAQDMRPRNPDWNTNITLGFALPLNSWIQFSVSRTGSEANDDGVTSKPLSLAFEDKGEVGLGITVWRGLALEGSHSASVYRPKDESPPLRQWSAGISYRSL